MLLNELVGGLGNNYVNEAAVFCLAL